MDDIIERLEACLNAPEGSPTEDETEKAIREAIGEIKRLRQGEVREMANVFDVSRYILKQSGEMTVMKLQKLVYYSQAWSLVWEEESLFGERIEAWANGPVVRALYEAHRGKFKVAASDFAGLGKCTNLSRSQKATIDGVLAFYGKKNAQWLSDLSHMEDPWSDARKDAGLKDGDRDSAVISNSSMHEYYSGL